MPATTHAPTAVPDPVRAVLERLGAAGHPSFLVGGCVRDLLLGNAPSDYDIATPASAEQLLALFPRAVPIGVRHGTVMLPTEAGPVDVTQFRAGSTIEDDLAHRDFTLNAIALDPAGDRVLDPFEGRSDLAKGLLRSVGRAEDRLAEDALRALRAARFVATLELDVDPALEAAMPTARDALARVARERVCHELRTLLLAPNVAAALALLRRTGLEAALAPGVAPDAAAVVAALPARLALRTAAWLRGTRAVSVMRGLRFPRRSARAVEALLRAHPIETHADPRRDASVRRMMRSVGDTNIAPAIALRRAELDHGAGAGSPEAADAATRLDALETAITRVRDAGNLALRRRDLVLSGEAVMRILGGGPGPHVGRALRFLTECVVEDPSHNTPEGLRALLGTFSEAGGRPTDG